MDDLTNSPNLLIDVTAVFDTITDSDSIASSLNTDINSLDYFLARSARRAHTSGTHTRPGEVAWIKSSANVSGYLLYPEIDRNTNYGRLTGDVCCSSSGLSWILSYSNDTVLTSDSSDWAHS
jgi:hypothetical protein